MSSFKANCLPALIGSLPLEDHREATKFLLNYTPEIPLWVQLPSFKEEGMVPQFLPGFPGVETDGDKTYIDTTSTKFEEEMLQFYEDYMSIAGGEIDIATSRFALTTDTAKGFFELVKQVKDLENKPLALKGQVTGPITFGTGVVDENGRAVFYNEQVKDILIKHLAMKAKFQAKSFKDEGYTPVIFFDEPALAGFGSSAYITITQENVTDAINELAAAVHEEGGLSGVHVCANTEWAMLLKSDIDVISFDAYSYFDNFILFPNEVKAFVESGKTLAWGIIPTSEAIENESADSLTAMYVEQLEKALVTGLSKEQLLAATLITPSCGAGSLSLENATKVLELTREVSNRVKAKFNM
ncbi:MAG: hypothetical protein GY714_07370 [Desulfobacterales bacterium]|nr:hypothetical protein [Desulfobacterales bacterium]MCP4158960.1 hypothetical protein [Deltaproteobacteria bacterium]